MKKSSDNINNKHFTAEDGKTQIRNTKNIMTIPRHARSPLTFAVREKCAATPTDEITAHIWRYWVAGRASKGILDISKLFLCMEARERESRRH